MRIEEHGWLDTILALNCLFLSKGQVWIGQLEAEVKRKVLDAHERL